MNNRNTSLRKVLLTEPPKNFILKAEVVAILPFIEDRILLLQRLPTHPQANLWVPPGGKINPGETIREAAVRELYEETGISTNKDSLIDLGKYYIHYPNGDFLFYLYKFTTEDYPLNIQIKEKEHQSYCLCTISQAKNLPLSPGMDECFDIALQKP